MLIQMVQIQKIIKTILIISYYQVLFTTQNIRYLNSMKRQKTILHHFYQQDFSPTETKNIRLEDKNILFFEVYLRTKELIIMI